MPATIMALQRQAGNRAVQLLIGSSYSRVTVQRDDLPTNWPEPKVDAATPDDKKPVILAPSLVQEAVNELASSKLQVAAQPRIADLTKVGAIRVLGNIAPAGGKMKMENLSAHTRVFDPRVASTGANPQELPPSNVGSSEAYDYRSALRVAHEVTAQAKEDHIIIRPGAPFATMVHEALHVYEHKSAAFPRWLSEGLTELFASMAFQHLRSKLPPPVPPELASFIFTPYYAPALAGVEDQLVPVLGLDVLAKMYFEGKPLADLIKGRFTGTGTQPASKAGIFADQLLKQETDSPVHPRLRELVDQLRSSSPPPPQGAVAPIYHAAATEFRAFLEQERTELQLGGKLGNLPTDPADRRAVIARDVRLRARAEKYKEMLPIVTAHLQQPGLTEAMRKEIADTIIEFQKEINEWVGVAPETTHELAYGLWERKSYPPPKQDEAAARDDYERAAQLVKLRSDVAAVRTQTTSARAAALPAASPTMPTAAEVLQFVSDRISSMTGLSGLVSVVPTRDDLKAALAEDMAARFGGHAEVGKMKSDPGKAQMYLKSAAEEVDPPKLGRAFTTVDDRIVMLGPQPQGHSPGAADSDLFHEIVHILSGKGGKNFISRVHGPLNEGFTQYFADEIAQRKGVSRAPAYPKAQDFVSKLVQCHGVALVYDAYFGSSEAWDALLDALAQKFNSYLQQPIPRLKDGSSVQFAEKPLAGNVSSIRVYIEGKVKQANEEAGSWFDKLVPRVT